jgi:hypothetical protein
VPQPPLPGIPAQESHRPVEGASAIPASTHQEGAATKKARLITEVDSVLGLRGPIHIRSLLEHLTTKRIMGHEQNPFKALGVFLATHTDRYQTDGKGNYSLRRATQAGPRFTMDDAVAAVTSRPNGHAGTTAHESSQEETGGVAPPVQPQPLTKCGSRSQRLERQVVHAPISRSGRTPLITTGRPQQSGSHLEAQGAA